MQAFDCDTNVHTYLLQGNAEVLSNFFANCVYTPRSIAKLPDGARTAIQRRDLRADRIIDHQLIK